MTSPASQFEDRGAFTLTELLVVLAIIAVLASLLMPAIKRMIQHSENSRCASNLRQMYHGLILYASDHDGSLPAYRRFVTLPDGTVERKEGWSVNIAPYLNPNDPDAKTISEKIHHCPSEKDSAITTHYGMNAGMSTFEKLAKTALPSKRFLLGDSRKEARITATFVDAAFRHPGERMNLIFFDGHVEARTFEEIPQVKNSPEYKAFFDGST